MKDLDQIYFAARELPPEERSAYLVEACGNDIALRTRVEQMLAVADEAEAFMADIPDNESREQQPLRAPLKTRKVERAGSHDEAVGQRIGRYKLLERIGEGGCGVVYVAEQTDPVRRKVALKVIKLGMDTRQVVARFEAERQALAMMDHPNIARALDAGTTEAGRPFFVMELVRGIKITDYCNQTDLGTKERLDLFMKVCHAIQHAHQKGIIHRDIKPSNILVTLHDGVPVPKVIDFGIAKATEGRLTDATVYTQLHQLIGTPVYMSPEQAEMSGLDIDTRSDIYSLGVLLYELLAGTTPFDAKELVASGLDAMRKTIREKEPPRPSTKLSRTLGAAHPGKPKSASSGTPDSEEEMRASSRRLLRVKETIMLLKGDLDWIVMKCLEKDRARRYETANGLAADLQRHLNHEPVSARPPSVGYRLQKAFQRNRLAFAAVGSVTAALLFGVVVSTWQAVRATHARQAEKVQAGLALVERDRALQAQTAAVQQRDLAEQRLYDSLVREAHSIRTIRLLGFRRQLIDRLQKALAVSTARKDTNVLRTEFAHCLGDAIGFAPVTLADPPSSFTDVAVNRDGTLVAYATSRGKLVLHETTHGQVIGRLEIKGAISALAFAPDGSSLFGSAPASNSSNATPARVIEWRRGSDGSWWQQSERAVPGLQRLITTAQGAILIVEDSSPPQIRLVDAAANLPIASIPWPAGRAFPTGFDVSSDFRLAAYVVNGGTNQAGAAAEVCDLKSGERRTLVSNELRPFRHLHFSPDSSLLAGTAEDGVIVFETTHFKLVNTYREFMSAWAVWCGDGTRLAIPRSQDNGVRLCAPMAGTESARVTTLHQVIGVRSSLDGSVLLMIPLVGPTQIARLTGGTERRRLTGHVGGVTGVAFSPDGRTMASTGKDGTIRVWDIQAGRASRTWTIPGGSQGQSIAFSIDGRWLASGNYRNGKVHVWRVEDGEPMLEFGGGPGAEGTWTCAFSPDGRMLVAAGDGTRSWELTPRAAAGNKPQLAAREVFKSPGIARNLQFHPTGKWIGFEGSIRQNGKLLAGSFTRGLEPQSGIELVHAHSFAVQTLGIADGGRALVHMTKERILVFSHPQSREVFRQLPTLTPNETASTILRNFQVSADGTRVAAANHNGRGIDITELAGGQRLYTLPDEDAPIWWLAWHPDGRQLAVARSDGDISLWDLPKVESLLAEVGLAP